MIGWERSVGRLSDVHERLDVFSDIVAQVQVLRREMLVVGGSAPHATLARLSCSPGCDGHGYQPLSLAPILDRSIISDGIAVGWHSAPRDADPPAGMTDHAGRLLMGRLIHLAKQYDTTLWSSDLEDVQAIGSLAAYALAATQFGRTVDLVVGAPSSRRVNSLPFDLARDIAFLTGIRYGPPDTLAFGRQVPQIKEIRDYWEKRELLHGAIDGRAEVLRGRRVLLVDDICRSGTTLHECARACRRSGATDVTVLAASKTFQFQRIPVAYAQSVDAWSNQ